MVLYNIMYKNYIAKKYNNICEKDIKKVDTLNKY